MVDGHFYICQGGAETSTGLLRCLDGKTGDILWEETLNGRPISLTAVDRKLIILDDKGMLYIAEASSAGYKEICSCDVFRGEKRFRKFWTPPVLCNGRIYCRIYSGDLVCIDVSK